MTTIRPEFQAIYETGEVLRHDIYRHLSIWPMEKDSALRAGRLPDALRSEIESLRDRVHQ
jgi:hypothetical protein